MQYKVYVEPDGPTGGAVSSAAMETSVKILVGLVLARRASTLSLACPSAKL